MTFCFGIRYNFCPNEDNTGVVRVVEIDNEDTKEKKSNERIKKGLKCKVPSILESLFIYSVDEIWPIFSGDLIT